MSIASTCLLPSAGTDPSPCQEISYFKWKGCSQANLKTPSKLAVDWLNPSRIQSNSIPTLMLIQDELLLSPSTSYNLVLCLAKNSHEIPVSSLLITTCMTLSAFRLYRIKTSSQLTSSSTMDVMSSPSEQRQLVRKTKTYQKNQIYDPDEIRFNDERSLGERSKHMECSA